jgi:hypothetical protein
MKYVTRTIFAGLLIVASLPAKATNDEPTITGGIEVTRGAIQQLADELAKRASETKLNARDYKKWSGEFVPQLNRDMLSFEEQVESNIVQKLQPMIDQYQTIARDTSLRPEQQKALESAQLANLQIAADKLAPDYAKAYFALLKDLIGWLPVAHVNSVDETKPHYSGFWYLKTYHPGTTRFSYQIRSLDGKTKMLSGESHNEYIDVAANPIALVDQQISSEQNAKEKIPSLIFAKYILPNLKTDCQSEVCITLKETDLLLTLQTLAKYIDRPFEIKISDNETPVKVAAPDFDVKAYNKYFSTVIADSSLPFDTK